MNPERVAAEKLSDWAVRKFDDNVSTILRRYGTVVAANANLVRPGTITSRKLVRSSGNDAWDDAVLRAIDKTETLPRDTDGRVPPIMQIEFKPRD